MFAQSIPRTEAAALTGAHIMLPDPAGTKPLLLLLGFSHKSTDDLTLWNKHFKTTYETDPRVQYREIADFKVFRPSL